MLTIEFATMEYYAHEGQSLVNHLREVASELKHFRQ